MIIIVSLILLTLGLILLEYGLIWLEKKEIISRRTFAKVTVFSILSYIFVLVYFYLDFLTSHTPIQSYIPIFMYYLGYTMLYGSILSLFVGIFSDMVNSFTKENEETKTDNINYATPYIVVLLVGIFGMLIVSHFG